MSVLKPTGGLGNMPEQIIRLLKCDRPGHEAREGRRWVIDNGHEQRQVILCPECEQPVAEAAQLGPVVPSTVRSRGAVSRGLSSERLDTLHRDNPQEITERLNSGTAEDA